MDLKQMFGDKYFITLDESWDAETPENRAEFLAAGDLWWYYEIKGRCGMVYPYSKSAIAIVLPLRAARRLVQLMSAELIKLQHADDAMSFKADAKHAAALVRFIKPMRLRPLTSEQKAALVLRLARYRFQKSEPTQTNHSSKIERASVGWQESEASGTLVPQVAYPANPPPHQNHEIQVIPQRSL